MADDGEWIVELQRPPTDICHRCGQAITLKPVGSHFKWFVGDDWHCGSDPQFPVRGHAPA